MYKRTIIGFGFFDIQNNQDLIILSLFWIYQKPHPIIVYFTPLEFLDEVFNFFFPPLAPNKSNKGVGF